MWNRILPESFPDLEVVATVAGECIGLIHDRPSAASIVETMVTQAQALLSRGATLDLAGVTRHGLPWTRGDPR